MPKEVNPGIHVNENDYPINDHHCDDPEKKKLVQKLHKKMSVSAKNYETLRFPVEENRMITSSLLRREEF